MPALHKSTTALSESCTCVQMFRRDVQSQKHLSDILNSWLDNRPVPNDGRDKKKS